MNQRKTLQHLLLGTIVLMLIAPVAIYIYHFSFNITSDHTRWAEMGSAIGGIYAPLLGLLTLAILWKQHQALRAQHQTLKAQHELQAAQHSFLQEQHLQNQSRDKLDKTIVSIKERRDAHDSREVFEIYSALSPADITAELKSGPSGGKPQADLTVLWLSAYNAFQHFNTPEDPISHWFYGAMRERLMAELGMSTCMTLDKIALLQRAPISTFLYDTHLNLLRSVHFQEVGSKSDTPTTKD
jgi:hypothetical protein